MLGALSLDDSRPTSLSRGRFSQLLVLGNGFDIECGLESRFPSFFEPRRERLESAGGAPIALRKTLQSLSSRDGLTVWDVILSSRKGDNWCDIEDAISQWAFPSPPTVTRNSFKELYPHLQAGTCRDYARSASRLFEADLPRTVAKIERFMPVLVYVFLIEGEKAASWSRDDLSAYLLYELGRLEEAFRLYLQQTLLDYPDYDERAWQLMLDLSNPECPDSDSCSVYTEVLNFNYTNPLAKKPQGVPMVQVNIHGSLGSEIVFGTDGKDLMGYTAAVPFTKTYRLLGLRGGAPINLFRSPWPDDARRENLCFNLIKFYGHSLSEADYSYFQSIFDEVDLYGGNTRLVFYCRPHGDGDPRTKMSKAVTRLLTKYGETMDNRDHGRNLMHKLLLEGRLSILELGKRDS